MNEDDVRRIANEQIDRALRKIAEDMRRPERGGFQPGGHLKPGGPTRYHLKPDECVVRIDDLHAGRWVCGRDDHPTQTSDCTTTTAIKHRSEVDPR